MTPAEQPAARNAPGRRSIAAQKEAIDRLSVERIGAMTGLAKRLIRRYRIKLVGWGPEDAVQDALHALALAADADDLGDVADDVDLWKLFCTTLDRQVLLARERGTAKKRGRGFQRLERDFDRLARASLSPEEDVASREAVHHMLDRLGDPTLRSVVLLRLEGRTNEEIAKLTGLSTRTVERMLRTIRAIWSEFDPGRRKVP